MYHVLSTTCLFSYSKPLEMESVVQLCSSKISTDIMHHADPIISLEWLKPRVIRFST